MTADPSWRPNWLERKRARGCQGVLFAAEKCSYELEENGLIGSGRL